MPLIPGSNVSDTIRELHSGKTFAHTSAKFGKERANKQAIAIALSNARKGHLAAGGVVPHYEAGGATTDPVQAVISALSAGVGTSGVAAPPGSSNPSSPSSVPATTSTAPPPANTQAQAQGVVPGATTAAAPGTNPAITAATPSGVAPVNNPIQKPLMASGGALKRQSGGFNVAKGPDLRPPFYERQAVRNLHIGPVLSNVPGRTDNHQIKVPANSYVLPAQHVASMGHGNTLAGVSLANKMFSGPYGSASPRISHGSLPRPPKLMTNFASGGYSEGGSRGSGQFAPVDVDVSGGEFIIPPWAIIKKFGSIKAGHRILDKWILDTRKREIEIQKRLPPPAKK